MAFKRNDVVSSVIPPKLSRSVHSARIDQEPLSLHMQSILSWKFCSSTLTYSNFLPKFTGCPLFWILLIFCQTSASAQTYPDRFDTLVSLVHQQLHAEVLEELSVSGKGVRIAVLDAGFKYANKHPALAHLFEGGQITATWDFVKGKENVFTHSDHGTQVLSALAGTFKGRKLGFAPDAEYVLFRTEHEKKEYMEEEAYWIQALDRAEALGCDIVVSSVNFTYARYSLADMNGDRVSVSRAAEAAAARGILLVVAMGNEGDKAWKYMGAPADAPSVISVGGSKPSVPMHIQFSSIGPNARGILKPEVAAPGYVLGPRGRKKYIETAGTSFSAPLIAGIAACLMEFHPSWDNRELYQVMCKLGHLYPYFDYQLGYGIPDLRKLREDYTGIDTSTFQVFFVSDTVFVRVDSAVVADSMDVPFGRVLHYHLESVDSTLAAFNEVLIPNGINAYYFLRRRQSRGILRIWYAGYLWEERIEMIP